MSLLFQTKYIYFIELQKFNSFGDVVFMWWSLVRSERHCVLVPRLEYTQWSFPKENKICSPNTTYVFHRQTAAFGCSLLLPEGFCVWTENLCSDHNKQLLSRKIQIWAKVEIVGKKIIMERKRCVLFKKIFFCVFKSSLVILWQQIPLIKKQNFFWLCEARFF